MADGTMGWDAVVGTNYVIANNTYVGVIATSKATISGRLYKFDAYAQGNTTTIIKVFRDDGTNYLYIGGESFSLSAGLNNSVPFITPINVLKNDLLAYYDNTGGIRVDDLSGGEVYKSGNIITDSLKSGWSEFPYKFSIKGYIKPISGGFFIFLSEAWERHKKLWTPKLILPDDLGFSY